MNSMKIDTSNLGYKYLAKTARAEMAVHWIGCVETDGERGALGLNNLTGAYLLYRLGSRPVELDPAAVLRALGAPVRFNQTGRPATLDAPSLRTVNITRELYDVAVRIGDGNMSLGVRRALEAYRPDGR